VSNFHVESLFDLPTFARQHFFGLTLSDTSQYMFVGELYRYIRPYSDFISPFSCQMQRIQLKFRKRDCCHQPKFSLKL